MSNEFKELLEKYSNQARVAGQYDKVYKDECVYSYRTSESEHGLFICLNTFICVSKECLPVHFAKTNSHLYLRVLTHRREIVKNEEDEPEKKRPTKLAIGVDGGFDLNQPQFYFDHEHFLFIYPEEKQIPLVDDNMSKYLTEKVGKSVQSVINAESITYKEELANQAASWDGEKLMVSKHSATLLQLPNLNPISPNPKDWKCRECGLTNNLWLNLTDGYILCGRKQLDGSGGNNHAIEHFNQTKYPLAVKLGTITAKGADVYSYDEDDMVEDANLAIHLAHLGINMSKMEKTEKTMTELEIDLNQKVGEWDRIQESGSHLVPLYGPGYTGMRNLGNSCYLNSVMQVLFSIPDFIERYANRYDLYLRNVASDPSNDFNFQMSRLGYALQSGIYSKEPSNEMEKKLPKGIKPIALKSLVGRGHVEFSTKRQQDAHEFFMYLLSLIERNLKNDSTGNHSNPADCFKFLVEDRIECSQSHQVRYVRRDEYCLSLPIAKSAILNKEQLDEYEARKAQAASKGQKLEPGDLVRPEIRFEDCLQLFGQDDIISDFYSSAVKGKVNALKRTRFATFPEYLLVQARKFELAPDWTPIKLDVQLRVPEIIDLNFLKGSGLQAGETELAQDSNEQAHAEIVLNEAIVNSLMDMGFSLDGAKRAAYNTREANDAEAAVNWAVAHMEDSDFNMPFQLPSNKPAKTNKKTYDEESIASLMSFGFTRNQSIKALEATNNNLERAADWIFNHPDELVDAEETQTTQQASTSSTTQTYRDGDGVYKLVAFISHMGPNANVGHYVAHILKNDKWTIFNDENVALSENPPKELAYLYLYKRV